MSDWRSKIIFERQRAIRNSAYSLIQSRGVDAMSVDEIARGAKMSVGCLYRYYASKNAIVLAVFRNALNEVRDMVEEVLAEPSDSLPHFAQQVVRATSAHRDLYSYDLHRLVVLALLEASRNEALRGDVETFFVSTFQTFQNIGSAIHGGRLSGREITAEAERNFHTTLGAFVSSIVVRPGEFPQLYHRIMGPPQAAAT